MVCFLGQEEKKEHHLLVQSIQIALQPSLESALILCKQEQYQPDTCNHPSLNGLPLPSPSPPLYPYCAVKPVPAQTTANTSHWLGKRGGGRLLAELQNKTTRQDRREGTSGLTNAPVAMLSCDRGWGTRNSYSYSCNFSVCGWELEMLAATLRTTHSVEKTAWGWDRLTMRVTSCEYT